MREERVGLKGKKKGEGKRDAGWKGRGGKEGRERGVEGKKERRREEGRELEGKKKEGGRKKGKVGGEEGGQGIRKMNCSLYNYLCPLSLPV